MTIKSHIAKRYVVIPFVYLLIIILLFLLQFTEEVTAQSSLFGLTFSGKLGLNDDDVLRTAEITFNGLQMEFDENKKMLLQQDGVTHHIALQSYDAEHEHSLLLFFEKDIKLEFNIKVDAPDSLFVYMNIPKDFRNPQFLSVPYSFLPTTELITENARAEAITLNYNNKQFSLLLPTGSTTKDGYLSVPISSGKNTIRYTVLQEMGTHINLVDFPGSMPPIQTEERQEMIQKYIDEAYSGWKTTRYNGGSGTWNMYNAPPQFSEAILTAYLAEAWLRGEYIVARNQMLRSATLHPDSLSFLSAPFLGNLATISQNYLAYDKQQRAHLLQRIRDGDISLFQQYDIMQYILMRADSIVRQEMLDFAFVADYRDADILSCIGMLHAYAQEYNSLEEYQSLQNFRPIIEDKIMPNILKIGEGIFLETATNEVSTLHSFHTGVLLENIGTREDSEALIQVGRKLIASVLDLADENFVPTSLFISERTVEPGRQLMGPEMIYPFIHNNPHYPHYIPLQQQLGPMTWAWTAINIDSIEVTDETTTLTLNSTPDYTHFIIMNNIPEFTAMDIFGIRWRNDERFEFYARGRNYDSDMKVLMIKYHDILPQNEIALFYGQSEN